jgi:hypothetical protein
MSLSAQTLLQVWFYLALTLVTVLVMAPVSRFIDYGWRLRKEEFSNKLDGKPIGVYLRRFWAATLIKRKLLDLSTDDQFARVYDRINGRQLYYVPAVLLFLSLVTFGGLALMSGMRSGYQEFVQFENAFKTLAFGKSGAAPVFLMPAQLDQAFRPFPPIHLTMSAVAAVAGAYLWTVQTVFRGYLTRGLLSTDLSWSAFRLIISIPLGLSVGLAGTTPLAPLAAFSLGALPISDINKLLRRLAARVLNDPDLIDGQDSLLKMSGVTADISSQLSDNGVYAPQQLIDTDPVSLTLRTGLQFDFVVNLIAQSQVWSWLGATTAGLAPTGYGDARMIHTLMTGPAPAAGAPDPIAAPIAALAAAAKVDPGLLRPVLQKIAADSYTEFLVAIS